jgi:hypothetical protein
LDAITNCEDNTRANYATDYLPNYTELRFELINAYLLAERRRDEMHKRLGRKDTQASPSWTAMPSPAPEINPATDAAPKGTALEIRPAEGRMEKFIKTLRNGTESRTKAARDAARARAKARESRKEGTAREDRCARTGAQATATAAMVPTASSPTTVLKAAVENENGMKDQLQCQRRQ